MRLYHGSDCIVECPEIRKANRTLDFGYGFYTTTSYEQAVAWVKRKMRESKVGKGFVNEYELDETAVVQLDCLVFERADEAWLDFVMENRTQTGFSHSYDLVYGPVANDKVYAAFSLYESGLLDKSSLIAELKTYKLVDQYTFHTAKSLCALTFLNAKEINQ